MVTLQLTHRLLLYDRDCTPGRRFSYEKGFAAALCELRDMAGQHEVITENITGSIIKDVQQLIAELRTLRKKVCSVE